ncbi:MAG: beta-lactamase family protein [Gemmatimonadota bacterium]|nr:beta-lactamase family protein [Gemmatimonadota bacterium]
MKAPYPALLVLALSAAPLHAQTAAATKPRIQNGFATDRLGRIDQMMQRYVDEGRIAGAVGLVMRDGRIVYERAVGYADKEAGRRMAPDAIFRIASQTKAITSAAILILLEEGRIGLEDPVSRYIPTFSRTTVASRSDTGRVTVPAKRAITIRDLLTHTAGISYGTEPLVAPLYRAKGLGPAAGQGWYTADKNEPICATMERLGTLPFVAQPGERYVYGYNTDILGCVVERASGIPLDQFIRTRITDPLGMKDTFFFLPPEKRQRLTAVYLADSTGQVHRAPNGPLGQGDYVDGPRRSFAGGAGLLSTARDYARFLQMLLNGGELDGARILAPKTIELMTTNQVGDLFNWTPGQGFGLAFGTTDRAGADGLTSVGSWWWAGAYSTVYKVDPKEGLVMVFMIQQFPYGAEATARFPTLVYQALVEPTK